MPSQDPRPRSSTSGSANSLRPKSRASTTSIQSASTQSIQHFHNASDSLNSLNALPPYTQATSYTPEELITRSKRQLTNPDLSYAIDPLLQDSSNHRRTLSADYGFGGNQTMIESQVSQFNPYDGKENRALECVNEELSQQKDDFGAENKKKKGSASTIANDQELRRLFRENKNRSLNEVAAQVLANERGPKSEKTKQIFAMLWIDSVCKATKGSSVPRNRVFTRYATSCGTERVAPLNPASFGKLVRIIFPKISTRRLGMRGESKYHYVDLSLRDDQNGEFSQDRAQSVTDVGVGNERPDTRSQISQTPAVTAVFPSPDAPSTTNSPNLYPNKTTTSTCLYIDTTAKDIYKNASRSNMVRRELKFSTVSTASYSKNESLDLPAIYEYLPARTDVDIANSLTALYRSHCISVIHSFRYCKEKMLWHHFTSFHGTLTAPVQKLLAHPKIAPWIKECNWVMYQEMIRCVTPLALQVMPVEVIDFLRSISSNLGSHISTTFQNHPQNVRDAKLGPAIIFAGLLDQLLRVNASAHAAANMLTNDSNRDQMWLDWVLYVKPTKVVESSLPCCGYTTVLRILTTDIHRLLSPLRRTMYPGMNPTFAIADLRTEMDKAEHAHPEVEDRPTGGVLDQWTSFLHDLPSRFPEADARLLLQCVNGVSSAALRDITMAQAPSFGSWWVTKVWVDEMLQWLAEAGGFMEHTPKSMEMRGEPSVSPEIDFMVDETSGTLEPSRPGTAAGRSIETSSQFPNVDVRRNGFSSHAQAARPMMQETSNSGSPHIGYSDEQYNYELYNSQHANHANLRPAVNAQTEPNHTFNVSQPNIKHEELRQASSIDMIGEGGDDSGIGMGLDDDEHLNMTKYGGFVANEINAGSDQADVVVC